MNSRISKLFLLLLVLLIIAGCGNKPVQKSAALPSDTPQASDSLPESLADEYAGMSNDELRSKVEARYSVEVYWNAEVKAPFPGGIPPLEDETLVRKFLILLDQQLALYPEGFFASLKEKDYGVRFFPAPMVNGLIPDSKVGGTTVPSDDGHINIAINASLWTDEWPAPITTYSGCPYIQYAIHHELGHALDWYIINAAIAFDYNKWKRLLPKGYKYFDDYELELQTKELFLEHAAPYLDEGQKGIWFCDYYAQTNREEHVASLFGYAMCPYQPEEWKSPHVQEQVNYYFSLISKVFKTEGWPARG
ncbi:MAG: hypothetical protein LBS74_08510 [Oscillospiraceae bacterium]|nr:hypothetical protein [Oscillospiraceae bacterium]